MYKTIKVHTGQSNLITLDNMRTLTTKNTQMHANIRHKRLVYTCKLTNTV